MRKLNEVKEERKAEEQRINKRKNDEEKRKNILQDKHIKKEAVIGIVKMSENKVSWKKKDKL